VLAAKAIPDYFVQKNISATSDRKSLISSSILVTLGYNINILTVFFFTKNSGHFILFKPCK
jgi:hypothetical protein